MPEEIQGQNNGEGQTPVAMPATNQPAEPPVPEPSTEGLPEDVQSRREARNAEQFEKLTEHNRQLAEENARLKQQQAEPKRPSVLEAFTPGYDAPPAPQPAVPQRTDFQNISDAEYSQLIQSSIDPRDGALDVNVLRQQLSQRDRTNAEAVARQAEMRAQQAMQRVEQFEVTQQARELHAQYPELDPDSDQFDPEAYDLVKKDLLDQLVSTGKQNAIVSAQRMSKYFRNKGPSAQEVAQQQQRQVATTAQVGSGQPKTGYQADQELADLQQRSRYDRDAMAERLRRSGY